MKQSRMILIVLFAFGTQVACSWGQELPTVAPEAIGLSSEKLNRVTMAVGSLIEEKKVAGAITVVARRGKIAYFEAVGCRDLEANLPMQRDSILRFYSMTKPITTAAAMMLVDAGKIDLDDPISKYLPEFAGPRVFAQLNDGQPETIDAKREPTVRDLMRHTSGLTYGIFGITPVDQMYNRAQVLDRDSTLADMTGKLARLPLLYQPGSQWIYSVSVDVLGRVVEVASGQPLDQFFHERIFRPLDMTDTGFFVPPEKLDRFATCYGPGPDGSIRSIEKPDTSPFASKPRLYSGGGGLVSTARDYLRFCQMIANAGELNGTRLLQADTVAMMTRNQLPQEAYPIAFGPIRRVGVGFGLGFSVQVAKGEGRLLPRELEFGWGGAASTHFWISPRDKLVVIALQQFMPFSTRLEQTIKPLVYESITQ